MTSFKVREITNSKDFDDLISNKNDSHTKKYVFVDFYADWCGPCKRISPKIDEYCKTYGDKIYFLKINVDEENIESIIKRYNISALPTFLIFDVGSLESKYKPIVGANQNEIEKRLASLYDVPIINYDF
ncbi:Thioredoxin [uncultured virus]|nr:Thioredoxin [uncultured virus]